MLRYNLRNATHMVDFPATCAGRMQAVAFRRSHPAFKRRHIREVLQLRPDLLPCGDVVLWTRRAP